MIDEIKRKAQRESEIKDLVVKTLQECMDRGFTYGQFMIFVEMLNQKSSDAFAELHRETKLKV